VKESKAEILLFHRTAFVRGRGRYKCDDRPAALPLASSHNFDDHFIYMVNDRLEVQVEVFRDYDSVYCCCRIPPWRWRQHRPLKLRYSTITLYGVKTQKTSIWISHRLKVFGNRSQNIGEKYIMRSFIICTAPWQILLECSNQLGWCGRVM